MKQFNEFLIEGMYDPSIFKAVFMAGGPGSGKSWVAGQTTAGLGMKIVNSDEIYELKLTSSGLGTDFTKYTEKDFEKSQVIRDKAKSLTKMRMKQWMDGRLGLVIDGTGHKFDRLQSASEGLRGLGYDTMMIFVNTSLDVALKRNSRRPRKLRDDIVKKSWENVQSNIGKFQEYFGADKFIIVDNNTETEARDPFRSVYKILKKIIQKPVENYKAKKWIEREKKLKKSQTFKEYFELDEFDNPQIYCDMDGVVADFDTGVDEMIGGKFKDERWEELPDDFFYKLPPMKDAKRLWNFIGKLNPFMLTAIPTHKRGKIADRAGADKAKWMLKHFNVEKNSMRAVSRRDKKQFAKDGRDRRPNILIDDHEQNIAEFRKAGGIGIHHTSAANTIKQLKAIGFK